MLFHLAHAGSRRLAMLVLLLASLVFYGYWNPVYLSLLLGSITFNYLTSLAMQRHEVHQGKWLAVGCAFNLGLLAYYKYASFIYANIFGAMGPENPFTSIILPLGISFFTFQQIAYLVDIRKERFPVPTPATYALSITFFPHLIAGPIILFRNMRNQIEAVRKFSNPDLVKLQSGFILFCIGLFKKVVIADSLAPFAVKVFDHAALPGLGVGGLDAWIGTTAYALQLYFDFSGYSDMAVGLARMFGFRIPFNFHSPYKAKSPIEFWRRWHISLMYFFREYLYIPLGGNRLGMKRQIANIMVVFFLTGLWHGAGWTFIVWGTLHGVLVSLNHLFIKTLKDGTHRLTKAYQHFLNRPKIAWARQRGLGRFLTWGLTMYAVMILWAVFRAKDLSTAWDVVSGLLFISSLDGTCLNYGFDRACGAFLLTPILAGVFFFTALAPNSRAITYWLLQKNYWWLAAALCGFCLYLSIASIGNVQSEFLYFQF
ncbi:MAG TPA: MBOAT family O-acyltransferase [Alphaproteobacteria bacterium]